MTEITTMYQALGISEPVLRFGREEEAKLKERFEEIDRITEYNQLKVIKGMQDCMVSAECFNYVSGYGYNVLGVINWKKFMRKYFTQRTPLSDHRLHAVRMHLRLHSVQISGQVMKCFLSPENHTIRWKK